MLKIWELCEVGIHYKAGVILKVDLITINLLTTFIKIYAGKRFTITV